MENKNIKSIKDFLNLNSIETKLVEYSSSTRTAEEAANAIGCTINQIIKSLIFKTKNNNEPILILVSGANRVNEKIVSEFLKDEIIKADATFVKEVTGFTIGGIPPINHKTFIRTLIDEDLMKYEELWGAAGMPNAVFSINNNNLFQLTKGQYIKIY